MAQQGFNAQQTDWNLIRAFVAVAQHGSLTRAALALQVSQPTLSRQIAELEQAMAAALFERQARGLRLTARGEALLEPAQRMLAAAQAVSLTAAAQDEALAGTVRLTASEMVSAYVLPPLLARLAREHPAIQIELVASNALGNLLEREADIAIRMVRPTQTALIARHIADWEVGFFAHRDYLAGVGGTELAVQAYRWIGLDQSTVLIDGFKSAGYSVDREFFAMRCENHMVNWQCVLAGLGVGIGIKVVATRFAELELVWPQQEIPPLPVWLTAHRELRSSPRLRLVFDYLAAGLAQMHPPP